MKIKKLNKNRPLLELLARGEQLLPELFGDLGEILLALDVGKRTAIVVIKTEDGIIYRYVEQMKRAGPTGVPSLAIFKDVKKIKKYSVEKAIREGLRYITNLKLI